MQQVFRQTPPISWSERTSLLDVAHCDAGLDLRLQKGIPSQAGLAAAAAMRRPR